MNATAAPPRRSNRSVGYHEMAQQHGTTLDRALNNYVTMEQKLRQDVIGGLDIIVNNLNLTDIRRRETRPARHLLPRAEPVA